MRKFSILAVAAVLGFPAMAFAGEYGATGTIEVGGEVSIQSGSTAYAIDGAGSAGESTTSTTEITLAPEVGYFLMDKLELIGRLAITSASSDDETTKTTSSGFGLGVGAAYLLPMGGIHVGPKATLGYGSNSIDNDVFKATESGPEIKLGGVAKVPFGTGGILGADLGITYRMGSLSGDVEGDATFMGFGLGTSFSVYW